MPKIKTNIQGFIEEFTGIYIFSLLRCFKGAEYFIVTLKPRKIETIVILFLFFFNYFVFLLFFIISYLHEFTFILFPNSCLNKLNCFDYYKFIFIQFITVSIIKSKIIIFFTNRVNKPNF